MIPWDHIFIPWKMTTSTENISNHYLPFQKIRKCMNWEGVVVHFDILRKMTKGWEVRGAPGTTLPLRVGHAQNTPLGVQLSLHLMQRFHHSVNSAILEKGDRICCLFGCYFLKYFILLKCSIHYMFCYKDSGENKLFSKSVRKYF